MKRRTVLGLMAASAVASCGVKPLQGVSVKDRSSVPAIDTQLFDPIDGARMNFVEAQRVMSELKVDALVLGEGINFRYASGFQPVITKMGWPPLSVAVLVSEPEPKLILIMNSFVYYYMAADRHDFSDLTVHLYGQADESASVEESLDAIRFFDSQEAPLDHVEQRRVDATRSILSRENIARSLDQVLSEVLKAEGVATGRLAFDSPALGAIIGQSAPGASVVGADDVLRRVRTIKSDVEIELMRRSSSNNIIAAHEALKQIGPGASYRDLRQAFYMEAAKRGSKGVFMVIDHVSDEQFEASLKQGQTFLIDCVSEHEGYHGDYGRTVFMGEPAASVKNAQIAVGKAWDRLRDQLRPGLRFSQIMEMGQQAMREVGGTYRVPFKPHSVGLYHSDHLGNGTSPPREDIELRAGMTLSIDCPVMHSGIGGSVHLEDLMLITEDGAEPLHDLGHQALWL